MQFWSTVFILSSLLSLIQINFAYNNAISNYTEIRHILTRYRIRINSKHGRNEDFKIDPRSISNLTKDDGTEVATNRRAGVATELFENDILLTLPQAHALLSESRTTRQAHYDLRYFWKHRNISYIFIGSEENWKNLIRRSLKHIEDENETSQDYLAFFRGSGCWSSVGRTGGRQHISIGYGCESEGIIAHETLHSLGLWHEQSRNDRDEFININYRNVIPGLEYNFEKRSLKNSNNLGQPYDIGSIMHYGSTAFTNDYNKFSITTKEQTYQHTMGQRVGLSFKDAKILNTRYCSDMCSSKKLNCSNGGYVDPNNCSQCRCPPGFGGITCNHVEPSRTKGCGGELRATKNYQYLDSPPTNSNMHCVWRITTPAARIEVLIDHIDLPCSVTCETYVELKYKTDFIPTGARICCPQLKNSVLSEQQQFIVIFKTATNNDNRFTGFKLRYRSVGDAPKNEFSPSSSSNISMKQNASVLISKGIIPVTVSGTVIGKVLIGNKHSVTHQKKYSITNIPNTKTEKDATVEKINVAASNISSRRQSSYNTANLTEKQLQNMHLLWSLSAKKNESKVKAERLQNISDISKNHTASSTHLRTTLTASSNGRKIVEGVVTKTKLINRTITGTVLPKNAISYNIDLKQQVGKLNDLQNTVVYEMSSDTQHNVSLHDENITLSDTKLLQQLMFRNDEETIVQDNLITSAVVLTESKRTQKHPSEKAELHKRQPKNYWSEWSSWSNCTVKCGGCGLRVRVRACYGPTRKCRGEDEQQERCGLQRCVVPKQMRECFGRILLPCNLLDQLEFSVPDSSIKYLSSASVPKFEITEKNIELLKRFKRKQLNRNVDTENTELCERRFTFQCPLYSVSLNIDWKTNDINIPKFIYGTYGCCDGYYFNGTICIPN